MNLKKISHRVILLLALPLISLIGFAGFEMSKEIEVIQEGNKTIHLATFKDELSAVINELQKERGRSAGFIASNGKKFSTALDAQRKVTDQKINILKKEIETFDTKKFGNAFYRHFSSALKDIEILKNQRQLISELRFSNSDSAKYYTKIITHLLEAISTMGSIIKDATLINEVFIYVAFLQAKEMAGIERASGAQGIGKGVFSKALYQKYTGLSAQQKAFYKTFYTYAPESIQKEFKALMQTPEFKKVASYRRMLSNNALSGNLQGMTAQDWFRISTAAIDKMHTLELKLSKHFMDTALLIKSNAWKHFSIMAIFILLNLVAVSILSYVLAKGITDPIATVTKCLIKLSGGDINFDTPLRGRHDEIGQMAGTLDGFKRNISEVRILNEQAQKNAEENEKKIKAEMLALADSLDEEVKSSVKALQDKANEMISTVSNMVGSIKIVSDNVDDVVKGSKESTENVDSVAKSTEELSSAVDEINIQVSQATRISKEAVGTTERTSAVVKNLSESANKINDIIALISDVAEQTNLLALNATIEAARAGESGKGFAVVAAEVKNLSTQTTKATDEITSQIHEIQKSTAGTVDAIAEITKTISEMDQISIAIAGAVEEQSVATQDITSNTQNVAKGTRSATQKVTEVGDEAKKTGAMADEVSKAVHEIGAGISHLQQRLSKIVRESSAGNRRYNNRYIPKTETSITVKSNSGSESVTLNDLATKGISFKFKGSTSFSEGENVTITIPGLSTPIRGKIQQIGQGFCRVLFSHNKEVEDFISSKVSSRQAA